MPPYWYGTVMPKLVLFIMEVLGRMVCYPRSRRKMERVVAERGAEMMVGINVICQCGRNSVFGA